MQDALNILLPLIFVLGFLAAFIITIKMCANDARRRGKSPFLVSVIVIFFFPVGLIAWILFRPEPLDGAGTRQEFQLENHRLQ